jgi:hypothetical protein
MTAKSLAHKFLSAVADGTDATLVRPSNWNADHDFFLGYRAVTGTTDTIANGDNFTMIVYNSASAVTVTLPAPTGGNMPLGWYVELRNVGAGTVNFSFTGGASINGYTSGVSLYQFETMRLHSTGAADYVGIVSPAPLGQVTGGILTLSSATALKFAPYNGSWLRHNGVLRRIPTAGIAGLGNTSVYVNGTSGQNLGASTTYYVYAFDNAGTITGDFRTDGSGHITDIGAGNEGNEVRASSPGVPDATRTLIGMCRTNSSSQFVDSITQRFVRSWFNQRVVSALNTFTLSRTTNSTASWVELNTEIRNEVLLWNIDNWLVQITGSMSNNTAGANSQAAIGIDGITPEASGTRAHSVSANNAEPLAGLTLKGPGDLTEGYHYATLLGKVSSGTATYEGATAGWKAAVGSIVIR